MNETALSNPALSQSRISLYLALTKPRLTLLAFFTTLSSFYLGSKNASVNYWLILHVVFGSLLIGGGSNALNQFFERAIDARMKRTQSRPLPSGRLEENKALWFGLASSLIGVGDLWFFANPLAGLIGLAIIVTYVCLYTPLKQKTALNTLVGAVAGALPTLMGWAAASGQLSYKAFSIFLILAVWQLPHFFTISWIYQEDYKRGGLKMLSAGDPDGRKTAFLISFTCFLLLIASFVPTFVGLTGLLYLSAAIFSGLLFFTFALYMSTHGLVHAREFVASSIFYLAVINIFLLFDKV